MFKFDIRRLVPHFILADKNGYALAKAIEAGIQAMNDIVKEGVEKIGDFDAMPEWRLDEMAWETNCLYDYNADIETKRTWIRNAIPLYRLYGTPQAIYQYIGGYFEGIELEENWVYGGEPYHFRITVSGEWTPENEAWARKAIRTAKNARSVLDGLQIGCMCSVGLTAESGVLAKFSYPMTGEENTVGRWPQDSWIVTFDNTGDGGIDADVTEHAFPYPMTGTIPNINTEVQADKSGMQGDLAEDACLVFPYKLCGQDEL